MDFRNGRRCCAAGGRVHGRLCATGLRWEKLVKSQQQQKSRRLTVADFYRVVTGFSVSALVLMPLVVDKESIMPAPLRLLFISLLFVSSVSAESAPWAQLKIGMSADEVMTVLGDPVSRRQGRGFETWTYDHGAEVLVYGILVGWTAPVASGLKMNSQDVWASHPKGAFIPTLQAALRKAVRSPTPPAASPKPAPAARPAGAGMGYEEYLRTMRETKA